MRYLGEERTKTEKYRSNFEQTTLTLIFKYCQVFLVIYSLAVNVWMHLHDESSLDLLSKKSNCYKF